MKRQICLALAIGVGIGCGSALADQQSGPADDGKIMMFNGKDLTGWVVEGKKSSWLSRPKKGEQKPIWAVKDGIIVCTGQRYEWLRYDKEFDDFVFHVEYRLLDKRSNSGLGIRTVPFTGKTHTRPSFASYEIQLLNDVDKPPSAKSTGSLYRYVAPSEKPINPSPEWNTIEVRCEGSRIAITLNGKKILDIDQSFYDKLKKKPLSGYLAIQSHSDPVDFRNIWVRPLSKSDQNK